VKRIPIKIGLRKRIEF